MQELLERHVAQTEAALHGDQAVECEQRDGKVAEWRGRKQIAADGTHVADRRPADRARGRMQEAEIALGQHARKSHSGADADARDAQ